MKTEFINQLIKVLRECVSIPSVSTDSRSTKGITTMVRYLSRYLKTCGLVTTVYTGYDNPIIVAKTPRANSALPTILVYGHYDVQPALMTDGWENDPFTLTEKIENGKKVLYARGIADNKAQILTHIYAVTELIKKDALAYNVTFLIEGNEETGSARLEEFIQDNTQLLASNCILVSDSELMQGNTPALEISFRGSANFSLTLTTDNEDRHSGLFGGVVPNAAEELSILLGSIPKFVDKQYNLKPGSSAYEKRRSLGQTIEVTGLSSGYIENGFRNSIPCSATAKINVRSRPDEDIAKLVKKVQRFLFSRRSPAAKKYAKITFVTDRVCNGARFATNNVFARKVLGLLEKVYGVKPRLKTSGGTLPIASTFEKVLQVPQIMVPIGDYECGAHGAKEHVSLETLERGIEFSMQFFQKEI